MKKTIKQKIKDKLTHLKWTNFIALTIAGIINSVGVTLFLYPVKIYDSGISGTSMLLDQVTPPYITLSLFLIILNIPIFIYGLKKQGLTFTIYSIFTVIIYSLMSFLFMNVFKIDLTSSPIAKNELILCAMFGGILSGIGSGITIKFGGALDGIDILSVIFSKKLGISIGTFIFIFNIILYIICGFVLNDWILPLYSIITYFLGSKTVDFAIEGFDKAKCAMIVTNKADEISQVLAEYFNSTGTIVKAIGGYSKAEKQIIYFILNHFQINKLKTIVMEIDKDAFISLQEVTDIFHKHKIE